MKPAESFASRPVVCVNAVQQVITVVSGLRYKKCVRSARRLLGTLLLISWAFPDSYRLVVLGWDRVVIEAWSACFQVGFVVVF